MGVPMLLASQPATTPPPAGFSYDFTQSPVLPAGATYVRAGAPQGYRDGSGNYVLAAANAAPWSYAGAALQGLFYRQATRPLTNLLQHDNYNPTDLTGFDNTTSLRVIAPNAAWSEFPFITAVHGTDGTSTTDNQQCLPFNPVGLGNPAAMCGFAVTGANSDGTNSPQMGWWSGDYISYNPMVANVIKFLGANLVNQPTSDTRIRLQSRSRATIQPQWVGQCVYAGNPTLDELDVAWGREATLNAGQVTFNIPTGTYAIGDIKLTHDGGTETLNTLEITVTGDSYDLDLADFGLSDITVLEILESTVAPGPTPEDVTFNFETAIPAGVLYAQPYQQIKRDATGETFLSAVAGQEPTYEYDGTTQGVILEKRHQNKLGYPNIAPFGGSGFTVVDDTAAIGQWSGVVPGNQVMDVAADYQGVALNSMVLHSAICIGRRLNSTGGTNSIMTVTTALSPIRSITREADHGAQRLTSFMPPANSDTILLRNTDQGLRAALLTVVEGEQVPLFPIYDAVGNSIAGDQVITIEAAAYVAGTYDIRVTMSNGVSGILPNQALSGNVSISADKADNAATYDLADFGIARSAKVVRQIQFTVTGSSPGPGPTPPPSGQLLVLRGMGVRDTNANQNIVDTPAWERINDWPPGLIKFMYVFVGWREIEVSEGVYDFSLLERYAEKADAYGVKVIPSIMVHGFHVNAGAFNPLLIAPDYVATPNPANFARFGGYNYPGFFQQTGQQNQGSYRTRRWDNNLMDVIENMMVATMAWVSGRPQFAGIAGNETAAGAAGSSPGGEDFDALNMWNRQNQMNIALAGARQGEQNYYFNMNWASGLNNLQYLNLWYDTAAQHQLAIIVNDPSVPSPGKFTGSNYHLDNEEVVSRKETPASTKGEVNGSTGDWNTLTSQAGDTWSHRRFYEYLAGGPSADPGHVGLTSMAISHWIPSGPSSVDDFFEFVNNPPVDAAYWTDYWQRPHEYIDKP